ncbi:MAG: PilZ domain-containing protein [Candidatus Sericytochromatia bacterium]|uniref:PilZ domain-containing protein n=1 Tax=Candidatus Tanganyikabacteria bacterium TaxID=2961651 RepID=A0A937X3Z2_9BACT|nr:PilZ domain-containing protein [Candidatus Tanganyikabacteria bacterium]
MSCEIAEQFPWATAKIRYAAAHHHERFDGSGYPRGLRGSQIGEEAMVVGLADAYDAMISDQPYRKRLDPAVAYRVIQSHSGKEWDPGLVWAFQRFIAPYPVNSLVKLNTGDEARVIAVRPNNLFKPIVQIGSEEVDLASDKERRIVSTIIPRRYYREKISLPVEVHVAGRAVITATMNDLSLDGLQLSDVREVVEVGTELDVTIPIPARSASLQIFGNVVWPSKSTTGRISWASRSSRFRRPTRSDFSRRSGERVRALRSIVRAVYASGLADQAALVRLPWSGCPGQADAAAW